MEIKIVGLEEVLRNLDRVPRRLAHGPIQDALEAACAPVMEALEINTPVETGELKASLTHDAEYSSNGGVVHIGFGDGIEGEIARWVEYGHRTVVGVSKEAIEEGLFKLKIKRVPAHPFMRPSAEESAEAAIEAFKNTINSAIDEGLGK
jgi:HK97 gp10 family phage protein